MAKILTFSRKKCDLVLPACMQQVPKCQVLTRMTLWLVYKDEAVLEVLFLNP